MRIAAAAAVAGLLLIASPAAALEIPPRTDKYVNDYADVLSAEQERSLEAFLSSVDQQTTNQIVVVTLASLEGLPPEEVTLEFAEAWKPGREDRDNGVVVGVFPNERKARIEVGYGLEGAIPDAIAATIMREEMVPAFRAGDWAGGITAGARALAQAAAGEYSAPAARRPQGRRLSPLAAIVLLFFGIAFWIFIAVLGRRTYTSYGPGGLTRRGGYWGGGGFGGGRGGFGGGFGGGGGGFGGGGASGNW